MEAYHGETDPINMKPTCLKDKTKLSHLCAAKVTLNMFISFIFVSQKSIQVLN